MRDATIDFFEKAQSDSFDPILLLQVQFPGQDYASSIRLTDAGIPVDVLDTTLDEIVVFQPLPLSRGEITERIASTGGELPDVTITVTNVNSQMATLLGQVDVSLATATAWITDRSLTPSLSVRPRNLLRMTVGEVRNSVLADAKLTFQIVNIMGKQNRIVVPLRVYKAGCNYIFGSKACGFNWKTGNDSNGIPARVTTTAQAGSTSAYIVVPSSVITSSFGNPSDPTAFLTGGYIQFTDGTIGLQSRPIHRVDTVAGQTRIYTRSPFLTAPSTGDPCIIQRVCQRTKSECNLYQGNYLQYGGFEEAPPVRFKPSVIQVTV